MNKLKSLFQTLIQVKNKYFILWFLFEVIKIFSIIVFLPILIPLYLISQIFLEVVENWERHKKLNPALFQNQNPNYSQKETSDDE